jgi:hypothetical protein
MFKTIRSKETSQIALVADLKPNKWGTYKTTYEVKVAGISGAK